MVSPAKRFLIICRDVGVRMAGGMQFTHGMALGPWHGVGMGVGCFLSASYRNTQNQQQLC